MDKRSRPNLQRINPKMGSSAGGFGWLKILGASFQADGETRSVKPTSSKEKRSVDRFRSTGRFGQETSICMWMTSARSFGK